jgi:hypothetical protein
MSLILLEAAFWLSLTSASSSSPLLGHKGPTLPPQTSRLHLNTGLATKVAPLTLHYNSEQLNFDEHALKAIKNWLKKVENHNSAIHLYSYSSLSKSKKNTPDGAARLAFNRAIIIQNFIEQQGIDKNRMATHLIGRNSVLRNDQIEITL